MDVTREGSATPDEELLSPHRSGARSAVETPVVSHHPSPGETLSDTSGSIEQATGL